MRHRKHFISALHFSRHFDADSALPYLPSPKSLSPHTQRERSDDDQMRGFWDWEIVRFLLCRERARIGVNKERERERTGERGREPLIDAVAGGIGNSVFYSNDSSHPRRQTHSLATALGRNKRTKLPLRPPCALSSLPLHARFAWSGAQSWFGVVWLIHAKSNCRWPPCQWCSPIFTFFSPYIFFITKKIINTKFNIKNFV